MKKGNNFMENVITIKELAKQLKKSESTIRTWKRQGDIPSECFKKIGTSVFVRLDKFNEFIDS